MIAGLLAVSLIGAGGVFLSSNAGVANNTIGINRTVLAGTTNSSTYTTYTVQSGNTLSGIAYKYCVTVSQLQQWNNISNPNVLSVGQTLKIYTNSSSNTAQIKWVLDNVVISNPNTVVIENTTGQAIPNNELATYMRDWILNAQYNYSGFADCNGTMWASQWLNTISNSQLVSYFENANGEESLSENITPVQLNKAAELLSDTVLNDHYNPFTPEQVTTYIKEMLAQSYQNQVVTNIVDHSGLYYVYTEQGENSTHFWYVNSSTGYATGV